MNSPVTYLVMIVPWILAYVKSELCDLNCGPGHVCTLQRSTCEYPPCPMFPTCQVISVPDTDINYRRHDGKQVSEDSRQQYLSLLGSVLSSKSRPSWSINRPGQCPAPASTGPCINTCIADVDCQQEQKCCPSRCGRSCRNVANVAVEKFGTCARSLSSYIGSCQRECYSDSDCVGHQKCCNTRCGAVCSDPCYYWLEPNQRSSRKSIIWKLPFICRM